MKHLYVQVRSGVRGRAGFTLIEMLVVVTIILVLVGLLVPTLDRAIQKAAYAAWTGFSKNIATDPDMVLYYNFERGDGNDHHLRNLAQGDPHSQYTYVSKDYHLDLYDNNAVIGTPGADPSDGKPEWKDGRWAGKGALHFDGAPSGQYAMGSDRIGQAHVNFAGSFTVGAWVRTDQAEPDGTDYNAIVTHGDNTWRMHLAGGGGQVKFDCNGLAYLQSNSRIDDGEWHFVTGVFDKAKKEQRIYVDGRLENTATGLTGDLSFSSKPVAVGQNSDAISSDRGWRGSIDEVFVMKRALDDATVKDFYSSNAP
ncbi:MAG: prepilin-type N-terminal cleavage/methylation domain-containing protein [Phycisphaera sp.]|nr:prepilin-type N-terminal cleavage/methylation domain-containing protein [Phycisphaera sp.]